MNTWQPRMQAKTLYGCKDCVKGIGFVQKAIRLDCDSQSAIFLAKNLTYNAKTKHIHVQYHFMRDMVEDKKVLLEKVDIVKNVVDSITNSISTKKFSWCRESMGIDALNL